MTRPPSSEAPNPVLSPVEGQRSFELNSVEAREALCEPPDPWVWAGGLPREPKAWPRRVELER